VTVGLVSAVEQRPAAVFAAFAALHLVIWSALPAALYPNLPLDLIEALTYGREWQLGYDKLPPLPWWLVEIVHRAFGADLFYYVLAQIAVLLGFACVWAMARRLTSATGALVALLILDGLHYVHFTAAKFNHDVIQLPFWALAGYAYWAALKHRRIIHWLALGFALGMALWAKYFVVVLAAPLVLFALFDRDARKCLATPGPYIAALVAIAIASPHLLWLVQNDFLPFRYADARATPSRGWIDHLWHPLQFTIGQLAFMLPALIIAISAVFPRGAQVQVAADAFDRRVVTLLAFGPALTVVALSLVSGRGTIAMWGYPLWMFIGLWIVLAPGSTLDRLRFIKIAITWAVVFTIFIAAFVVSYGVMPIYDGRYRAVFFPGDKLGSELSARFRALTQRPLTYVIGSMWVGGNAAHYSPDHPRVLIDGRPSRAPWIDLGDMLAKGAAIVWTSGDGDVRTLPPAFRSVAEYAEVQEPLTLPYRRGAGEVTFGWALLRPRPAVAAIR
jgi:4-amino-4-deoxy-L-arabinose transferase-like glycosyltransferase